MTKHTVLGIIYPINAKLKELANSNNEKEVASNLFALSSEAGAKLESVRAVNKFQISCSFPNGDARRNTD